MNPIDQALFAWLNLDHATPQLWVALARFSSERLFPAALILTVLALVLGRKHWRSQAARALVAVVVASIAAYWLKQWCALPRPAVLGLGVQWFERGQSFGFPSSHAAAAAAWAVCAAMVPASRWLRGAFLVIGVLVGWSRVALGVHFPSDVAAGWVLGALVAVVVHVEVAWAARQQGLVLHRLRRWRQLRRGAPAQRRK